MSWLNYKPLHDPDDQTKKSLNTQMGLLATLSGVYAFFITALVLSGTWGKNDEYVYLGLFRLNGWNWRQAFEILNPASQTAGRPLSNLYTSLVLPHIKSVSDFTYFHISNAIASGLFITVVVYFAGRIFNSKFAGLVFGIALLSTPGYWALNSFGGTAPFTIAFAISAGAGGLLVIQSGRKFGKSILFLAFFLILTSSLSYQAAPLAAAIFPAVSLLRELMTTPPFRNARIREASKTLSQIFFTIVAALFLNAFYVFTQFNSTRAEGPIDIEYKLSFLANEAMRFSVGSYFTFFAHLQPWTILFSGMLLAWIATSIFRHSTGLREQKIVNKFTNFVSFTLLMTSLIPVTLIPLVLPGQLGADHRRFLAGTMTVLALTITLLWPTNGIQKSHWKRLKDLFALKILLVFLFTASIAIPYIFHRDTVRLAAREWEAAKCATSRTDSLVGGQVNIRAKDLEKLGYVANSSDEFKVRSLLVPVAGPMMLWLSSEEISKSRPIFSPWETSILPGELTSNWAKNFVLCNQ